MDPVFFFEKKSKGNFAIQVQNCCKSFRNIYKTTTVLHSGDVNCSSMVGNVPLHQTLHNHKDHHFGCEAVILFIVLIVMEFKYLKQELFFFLVLSHWVSLKSFMLFGSTVFFDKTTLCTLYQLGYNAKMHLI